MIRYFKENETYFKWVDSSKNKYNVLHVNTKDVKVKGEEKKKENRIVVKYCIKVRDGKNMEFISIYMLLDRKTQKLVDGLGRLRFKERKANLEVIKKNMEALKIRPDKINTFINEIKLTLDMR